MKEFLWAWLFWASLVFCGLLAASLLTAFWLFSTAPMNPHTAIFASGFGFAFGFLGLGAFTLILFDKLSRRLEQNPHHDGEFFQKLIREMPFLFFTLIYFFAMAGFIGIFLLMLSYIKTATM